MNSAKQPTTNYIYLLLTLAFKNGWVDSGRNLFLLGGREGGRRRGREGEAGREGGMEGGGRKEEGEGGKDIGRQVTVIIIR